MSHENFSHKIFIDVVLSFVKNASKIGQVDQHRYFKINLSKNGS